MFTEPAGTSGVKIRLQDRSTPQGGESNRHRGRHREDAGSRAAVIQEQGNANTTEQNQLDGVLSRVG